MQQQQQTGHLMIKRQHLQGTTAGDKGVIWCWAGQRLKFMQ